MIGPPMRFQLAVAVLAVGGTLVVTESQGPRPDSRAVLELQDPAIDESSGLLDTGEHVLTVNDSGDGAVVYVVDKATGETVGRTTFADEVRDVEAMAPGPGGTLWVGDVGDNPWSRPSVAVYELAMPTPGDRTVEATRYDLVYEGGPRDAEALLVHPTTGRLHVVSKGLFGGEVFRGPAELSTEEPNVLRPVGDAGGLVTDGAFLPDGRYVALRSYSNLTVLDARTWRNVGGMPLPDQKQGEGLAVTPSGRSVLISTEGAGSVVLEVPLTTRILERVAAPASPSSATSPSSSATPLAPDAPRAGSDDGWAVAGLVAVVLALLGGSVWFLRRQSRSTT